jgi:hypothetical protein
MASTSAARASSGRGKATALHHRAAVGSVNDMNSLRGGQSTDGSATRDTALRSPIALRKGAEAVCGTASHPPECYLVDATAPTAYGLAFSRATMS